MVEQHLRIGRYSIGIGDRFAHQAKAQLKACIYAMDEGLEITPVWNKSNREHLIIGSDPSSVRQAADEAVKALQWTHSYYCDADHITQETVDRFLGACDFYTLDVSEAIGKAASAQDTETFIDRYSHLIGKTHLQLTDNSFEITKEVLRCTALKYLAAIQTAGETYRKIAATKGAGNFISEISMDETDTAQTPIELLIILAAIAGEGIPVQTIAPKFSGRFNKGVDYVGDIARFEREFALDIATINYAVRHFNLPENLKLSIHSGSDKFSIYPTINATIKRLNAGLHLKTAGTTWLEELTGLAEAGGQALALVKDIYADAYAHREELCKPYATVIDIDSTKLPRPAEVNTWTSKQFASALRHVPNAASYNKNLRQLLHVGFKIAAMMGPRYLEMLEVNEKFIGCNVTENLFSRHIVPVFLG